MPTNIRQFRCEHVSATEAGEGFQVLFEKCRIAMRDMYSSRGTSSFPMEGMLRRNRGPGVLRPFPDTNARPSRNRFEFAFGRGPVKKIAVFFNATDPVYAEVKRVLRIMIPEIDIS